jgi:hypothetical protein
LYEHFRLGLDPGAASRIGSVVEAEALAARSAKQQRLDRYRIDAEAECKRFAPYTARFGIDREPGIGSLADALARQAHPAPPARATALPAHSPLIRGSD